MNHIPCSVHCATGHLLGDPDNFTPEGFMDCLIGSGGPIDATDAISRGGFGNIYFNDGVHDMAQSFCIRGKS